MSPIELECVPCNGRGCEDCNDVGAIEIKDCPLEVIDDKTLEVIEYAELWQKGIPPIAGGALDQAYTFTQAARFVWSERNYWKKKLKI